MGKIQLLFSECWPPFSTEESIHSNLSDLSKPTPRQHWRGEGSPYPDPARSPLTRRAAAPSKLQLATASPEPGRTVTLVTDRRFRTRPTRSRSLLPGGKVQPNPNKPHQTRQWCRGTRAGSNAAVQALHLPDNREYTWGKALPNDPDTGKPIPNTDPPCPRSA